MSVQLSTQHNKKEESTTFWCFWEIHVKFSSKQTTELPIAAIF